MIKAIVTLFVLLSAPPAAQGAECQTLDKVRSDVAKFMFPATVSVMDGKAAAAFLAAYNRVPPITNLSGDIVVSISAEGKPNVVVVLFEDGCATRTMFFPRQMFLALITGAPV